MLPALLSTLLAAGLLVLAGQHRTAPAAAAEAPIRAAFYYGWFPETEHWASHYTPAAGKYDSSDPAVVATQVRQAKSAGLNAFISSWWGQATKTDSRLPLLLSTAAAQGFKVAPYYEKEGFGNPTADQLASDLGYLAAKAAASPAWLRVGGRPVLFVYNADDTNCAVADRWASANQGRFYLNLKVMPGYQNCAHQPDVWHQYGPASAIQQVLPWSVNVAPGFFKFDEATPRLDRNLNTFKAALAQQVASGAQWQLVTSWNEWGEGTGVEPTTQFTQSYLDAMAGAYLPAGAPVQSPSPSTGVASADSYVRSNAASANYGTAASVQQNATSSATAVSYLRFPAPAGTVAKATLRLFSRSNGLTRSKVFSTSASWDERTLTWANRPALGTQVSSTGTLTAGQWTEADVTGAVRAGTTSFGLTTTATATRYFDSREAANPPQLVIEYSSGSPTSAPPTSTAPTSMAPTSTAPTSTAPTSTAPTSTAPTSSAPTSSAPTSSAPAPSGVTKLLTVVVENHSLGQVQSGMPYVDGLARQFGYANNYTAIRHPSLPNYLAMAGGDTFGVTDDAAPSSHPLAGDSVFDQALAQGRTAGTYAESMTSNCQLTSLGRYAVKHNPWAYFAGSTQRANCKLHDLPAGTPTSGAMHNAVVAGTLPDAGYWIPDLCDDAHDCSLTIADNYLKSWLPQILAGPDFTSGRLAVVITADEDDSHSGNVVLTAVLHRSLDGSHKVVTTALNHYSLLRLYDQVLGAPLLRNAATASNMATAFGLPVG